MKDLSKHRQFSPAGFESLIGLLKYRAATQPRRKAFVLLKNGEVEIACLTFSELDLRARSVAARLQQHFKAGDRVLLACASSADFIHAFFGCIYAGVVPVPTAAPSGTTDVLRLAALARESGALGLCMGREGFNQDHLLYSAPELGKGLRCLTTSDDTGHQAAQWVEPRVDATSPAVLPYTAGTTGAPKGVLLSHGNLLHNQQLIQESFGHSSRTVGVSWLPLHRDMGLIGYLLQPLYLGCTSVLMSPAAFLAKPLRWLQAISKYRAKTSGGPGFAYELCVRRIKAEQLIDLNLESWDLAFVGAGPVQAQTLARFAQKFEISHFRPEALVACYGLTEATLLVSSTARRQVPATVALDAQALERHAVRRATAATRRVRHVISCGRAPRQQVLIVDPDTRLPCDAGRVGEIWIRGGSVARGYWQDAGATQAAFDARLADSGDGPFLRTGDLGFMLDGELHVTGTLKELIVIRGRHYYPQDIEEAVRASHPMLQAGEAAAICVDAGKKGGRLVVMQEVQHADLNRIPRAEVLKIARNVLRNQAGVTLQDIVYLKQGTLPRTAGGRIQREMAWAAAASATSN